MIATFTGNFPYASIEFIFDPRFSTLLLCVFKRKIHLKSENSGAAIFSLFHQLL